MASQSRPGHLERQVLWCRVASGTCRTTKRVSPCWECPREPPGPSRATLPEGHTRPLERRWPSVAWAQGRAGHRDVGAYLLSRLAWPRTQGCMGHMPSGGGVGGQRPQGAEPRNQSSNSMQRPCRPPTELELPTAQTPGEVTPQLQRRLLPSRQAPPNRCVLLLNRSGSCVSVTEPTKTGRNKPQGILWLRLTTGPAQPLMVGG